MSDATRFGDILDGIIPPAGRYPCNGGCGDFTVMPGVCDPCAARVQREEQDAGLAAAYASIPAEFRWARPTAQELTGRVHKLKPGPDVEARVRALGDAPRVLLHGAGGAGKTSLACAVLRHVIDAGRYPAPAAAFNLARRARFVAARCIADRRDESEPYRVLRSDCARASVLVLDDVGQEAGDGYRANDRSKLIADILADRHDANAQTIVTTFADESQWRSMYGDGIARRFWDTTRVKVVRL